MHLSDELNKSYLFYETVILVKAPNINVSQHVTRVFGMIFENVNNPYIFWGLKKSERKKSFKNGRLSSNMNLAELIVLIIHFASLHNQVNKHFCFSKGLLRSLTVCKLYFYYSNYLPKLPYGSLSMTGR